MPVFFMTFIIIFMLHNLEEIITIERWMKKTYPRVRKRIPSFIQQEISKFQDMTAARFAVVVFIISVGASLLLLVAVWTGQVYLFLGLNIVFAVNLFTHPLQALFLRCYVPGLWTSITLIIPYYMLLFFYISFARLWNIYTLIGSIFVAILFILLFLLSHKIGEKVSPLL